SPARRRNDVAGAARAGPIGQDPIVYVGVPNRTRRTADRALRLSADTFGGTSEGLLVGLQRLPSRRRLRRLRRVIRRHLGRMLGARPSAVRRSDQGVAFFGALERAGDG